LLPTLGFARFEFGGGMEYFSTQVYAQDMDGQYFLTLLQSTMATARAAFTEDPLTLRVSGGYSSWSVFGNWQGTGLDAPISFDEVNVFARQQFAAAEACCRIWAGLELGVRYEDRLFRHYYPDNDQVLDLLQFRLRSLDTTLGYALLDSKSLQLHLEANYSPRSWVEAYQNTGLDPYEIGIHDYSITAAGTGWGGRIFCQYRDSAGWGLDLVYAIGWTRFAAPPDLAEYTLRRGMLSGCFLLFF
jgi:hypothetical protein